MFRFDRIELNKAFSSLSKYLLKNLERACSDISSSVEHGVGHYTMLYNHLNSLASIASDPKTWQPAKNLQKEFLSEKQRHMRALIPGLEEMIGHSVRSWNSSEECKKLSAEVGVIYNRTKKSDDNFISTKDYNTFLQFTLLHLSKVNANRKTVISKLTNAMLWSAELVYKDDNGQLHIGVNRPDDESIGRVVTLHKSSGATKTDESVSIYIDTTGYRLMNMYSDVKQWYFQGRRAAKVC